MADGVAAVSDTGLGGFEIDVHTAAEGRCDIDQRVEREAGDAAAEEIVDAGLGHAAA